MASKVGLVLVMPITSISSCLLTAVATLFPMVPYPLTPTFIFAMEILTGTTIASNHIILISSYSRAIVRAWT